MIRTAFVLFCLSVYTAAQDASVEGDLPTPVAPLPPPTPRPKRDACTCTGTECCPAANSPFVAIVKPRPTGSWTLITPCLLPIVNGSAPLPVGRRLTQFVILGILAAAALIGGAAGAAGGYLSSEDVRNLAQRNAAAISVLTQGLHQLDDSIGATNNRIDAVQALTEDLRTAIDSQYAALVNQQAQLDDLRHDMEHRFSDVMSTIGWTLDYVASVDSRAREALLSASVNQLLITDRMDPLSQSISLVSLLNVVINDAYGENRPLLSGQSAGSYKTRLRTLNDCTAGTSGETWFISGWYYYGMLELRYSDQVHHDPTNYHDYVYPHMSWSHRVGVYCNTSFAIYDNLTHCRSALRLIPADLSHCGNSDSWHDVTIASNELSASEKVRTPFGNVLFSSFQLFNDQWFGLQDKWLPATGAVKSGIALHTFIDEHFRSTGIFADLLAPPQPPTWYMRDRAAAGAVVPVAYNCPPVYARPYYYDGNEVMFANTTHTWVHGRHHHLNVPHLSTNFFDSESGGCDCMCCLGPSGQSDVSGSAPWLEPSNLPIMRIDDTSAYMNVATNAYSALARGMIADLEAEWKATDAERKAASDAAHERLDNLSDVIDRLDSRTYAPTPKAVPLPEVPDLPFSGGSTNRDIILAGVALVAIISLALVAYCSCRNTPRMSQPTMQMSRLY